MLAKAQQLKKKLNLKPKDSIILPLPIFKTNLNCLSLSLESYLLKH